MQFFPLTDAQRRDALAKPARFAVREYFRFAATMALLFVIRDGIWPIGPSTSPVGPTRLYMIAFWSAGMTGLTLLAARRRQPRSAVPSS